VGNVAAHRRRALAGEQSRSLSTSLHPRRWAVIAAAPV